MEAFLSSTLAVAVAEIGDKTQLLALLLVSRFGRPYAVSLGILCSTLLNHAASAWLGARIGHAIPAEYLPWIVSGSLLLVAIWLLIPDKEDDNLSSGARWGAFLTTCIAFFLAEIGDKTQIATVILAAEYKTQVTWVVAGTTLGMLIANLPVVFAGKWLMDRLPLALVRKAAFVLFAVLAFTILATTLATRGFFA